MIQRPTIREKCVWARSNIWWDERLVATGLDGFFQFFDFLTNLANGNQKISEFVQLQPVVQSFAVGFSSISVFFLVEQTGPVNTNYHNLGARVWGLWYWKISFVSLKVSIVLFNSCFKITSVVLGPYKQLGMLGMIYKSSREWSLSFSTTSTQAFVTPLSFYYAYTLQNMLHKFTALTQKILSSSKYVDSQVCWLRSHNISYIMK